ncbi:MAG: helix-turn-helix transcriptional regulator [Deltaproteobacteria bacterium]|nr:helix-turn-helix transcriptional regulator [Deltaproteobacteria bacterium]
MPRLKKPDPLAKAIGQRVRELRLERELTIEKLAYENSMSKGTVSDLERGLARPSVVTLKRIAKGLDVELLDLFTAPTSTERHRVVDLTRGASLANLRAAADLLRGRARER